MKTRFLIIIGILTVSVIVALTIGTSEYQTEYNQNCHDDNGKVTGFLSCTLIHEDFSLPNPFTVGIPFDQTFQYEDLKLYFYDIEDSRCPLDVTCVWEGEVTAMIHVRNQTHKTAGFFTPNYTISYITPYNVTLVDIQPHPISTEKPDYIATLEITKLDVDNFEQISTKSSDIVAIPSAKEFLKMGCEDLTHVFPEFPSEEVADAWNIRMHECINEQESLLLQTELKKWNEISCIEILNNPEIEFEDNVDKRAFDIRWKQCLENEN